MRKIISSKVFRKSFLTYLIILLIPIIALTAFFYTYFIKQFQKNIYELEQKNCEAIAIEIETYINQLKDLSLQISLDKDILAYNLKDNILSQIKLIDTLRYSLSFSDFIEDIFLVSSDNMLFSATGSYQVDNYSNMYNVPVNELMNKAMEQTQYSRMNFLYQDEEYVYFFSEHPFGSAYPTNRLFFKFKAEYFKVKDLHAKYSVYFDGDIVAATDTNAFEKRLSEEDIPKKKDFKYFSSKSGPVTVVAFIDEKTTFSSYYSLMIQLLWVEFFTIMITLFLISCFSYWNYHPIKELNKALVTMGMRDDNSLGDVEFSDSVHSLEILFDENRQLGQKIEIEKFFIRELILSKLLEGRYSSSDEILNSLRKYDVNFNKDEFCIIVLKCNKTLEQKSYYDIFNNIHFENINVYFCYDTAGRIVVIVNGYRLVKNTLGKLCKNIISIINRSNLESEAYIGTTCTELNQINKSYIKAISSLNYNIVNNGELHWPAILPSEEHKTYYPQAELNSLLIAMKKEDYHIINKFLQTIITQISQETCDFSFTKTIAYALINTMIKAVDWENLQESKSIRGYLFKLEGYNCKGDIINLLEDIHRDLIKGRVSHIAFDSQEDKMEQIMQYMNISYSNPDFYIGTLVEKFNISSNNLSQQFKRRFGVTPVKYLASLRIDKAKRLLVENDYSIGEISQMCGFNDFSSFNRNFKEKVSLSSRQYREVNKTK